MNFGNPLVTISILTCERKDLIERQIKALSLIQYTPLEIIIVDNSVETDLSSLFSETDERFHWLPQHENKGVGARNIGLSEAKGEFIICLDDDVFGITDNDISFLVEMFQSDSFLGAACFKVINPETKKNINWCHHRKIEDDSNNVFITNEITEGAVAFRNATLKKSGYYPDFFFISHEGPDLAIRIMNAGYTVYYRPEVVVEHHHSLLNRKSWRRYYYDTRNLFFLVIRNYPVLAGILFLSTRLCAMFIYALRDGFLRYWFRAVFDALRMAPKVLKTRVVMNNNTMLILRNINQRKPSFFYLMKRRLFLKEIKI
jgi:GT2 family glycosyltransferase